MRKRIVGLMVLIMVAVGTSFANNNNEGININERVLLAFNQEFIQAKEVTWEKNDAYYKATFKMNDQFIFAYFSEDGAMMGVSRNIYTYQLPINLQTSLKKDYAGYWITDLFEFAVNGETVYYASVENAGQKILLKSTGTSEWTSSKKIKKN